MTKEDAVSHWKTGAESDWEIAGELYRSGKYSYALFFCHLAIEKLLKALFAKKSDDHPPYIHNLYRLATVTGMDISETDKQQLDEITTFNMEARYDDIKYQFHRKATAAYARSWMDTCTRWKERITQLL